MPHEGCQNWSLSYNLGMARPIATKFGVLRDQVAMHNCTDYKLEHLHVDMRCTCAGVLLPTFVSLERLDGLR